MKTPRRITSSIKPNKIENLNNGNWYYNYDITETPSFNEENEVAYSFIQVKMAGKPDYKRCVEYIIREYITQSQEFDLINSYNKVILGITTDSEEQEEATAKYKEYLNVIKEIKEKIYEDFEKLN